MYVCLEQVFFALLLCRKGTCDINTISDNIQKALHETAVEVFGKERKKNKPWVTDDILEVCDKRRELKKTRQVEPEAAKLHKKMNMKIEHRMKGAKQNWIASQCDNINMKEGTRKVVLDTLMKPTRS